MLMQETECMTGQNCEKNKDIYQEYHNIMVAYNGFFPRPVISIANELGIDVKETDKLDSNLSGVIGKDDKGQFIILINKKLCSARKVFTIAHEIGHFILHQNELNSGHEIVSGVKMSSCLPRENEPSEYKRRETDANKFAAELLMPEKEFVERCLKVDSIEEIANYFGVSVPAATIRANSLGWMFI